jgi:hypothetical protein
MPRIIIASNDSFLSRMKTVSEISSVTAEQIFNNYGTKEEMMIKLDVFLLNNRIIQDQYNELAALLNAAA